MHALGMQPYVCEATLHPKKFPFASCMAGQKSAGCLHYAEFTLSLLAVLGAVVRFLGKHWAGAEVCGSSEYRTCSDGLQYLLFHLGRTHNKRLQDSVLKTPLFSPFMKK